MKHHLKYLLAIAVAALLSAVAHADSAGTVTIAGKEWMRCSLGQTWEGNTCVGEIKKYTFDEAKAAARAMNDPGYAGKRDWRVPTVRELQSLRVCSTGFVTGLVDTQDGGEAVSFGCKGGSVKATIDLTAFPKTPASIYWSSSPYAGDSGDAWYVVFSNGLVGINFRSYHYYARLVR